MLVPIVRGPETARGTRITSPLWSPLTGHTQKIKRQSPGGPRRSTCLSPRAGSRIMLAPHPWDPKPVPARTAPALGSGTSDTHNAHTTAFPWLQKGLSDSRLATQPGKKRICGLLLSPRRGGGAQGLSLSSHARFDGADDSPHHTRKPST